MTIWDARVRFPRRKSGSDSLIQEPAFMARYDQILGTGESINRTLDDLLAEMDEAGIDGAIMHAEYEHGMLANELNRGVADIVHRYPQKFVGFGTVTMEPFDIMKSLDELKRNLEVYGFRGINIEPSFFGVSPTERRFYPLYAWACEHTMPVALHAGVNYSVIHPIKNDHPLLFDEIACDFPELTLIACHGGWPWTAEMVAVARKHPRIFLDFGGLAPKYLHYEGSGWSTVWQFARTLLQDQVLYATDWPIFSMRRALQEWRELNLPDGVWQKLTVENVQRIVPLP